MSEAGPHVPGSEHKKAARKRAKRAPVTTRNHVPERAENPRSSRLGKCEHGQRADR
jgi:hypothetical protein